MVRDALKHLNAEQQEWRLELAAPEVRRRGRPCEGLTQEETECLVRCEAGDGMGQGVFVCVFRREEREVMGEEERKALQMMISLLKEDQVELRLALIHHILCLDESLMEEESLDKDKSLLYSWERGVICRFFVLSRMRLDTESVKAVLVSRYYINELYQRYWDSVVSSLA